MRIDKTLNRVKILRHKFSHHFKETLMKHSGYRPIIEETLLELGEDLKTVNPAYVEAWMRVGHRNLGSLHGKQWKNEVALGAKLTRERPDESKACAKTFLLDYEG